MQTNPSLKTKKVNWSLDFGCTMTIKCIWILHLVLKSRFLPTVARPSGITSLSPKLPLWNTGNSPVFTPGSKTIWHRQSVTPTPLCEILATGLFISDSCNSTYLFKCEPLKTKRINFHCNVRHKKIFKVKKYYHGYYLTCIYINFNTDNKFLLSQYICQIIHFSAVLYTSERKTDFRLDYQYFLFLKMYIINNSTFTFNLVLVCIAYSFLKTLLSFAIMFTSLIIYGLVINSTFTFNIVYIIDQSCLLFPVNIPKLSHISWICIKCIYLSILLSILYFSQ